MITFISVIAFCVIISGVVSDPQLCVDQKSVELVNRTYNGITFGDDEIILSNTTGEERGCVCLKGTCARKCCPFGWVYNEPIMECVPSSYVFDPPVGKQQSGIIEGFNATKEFIFMVGKMNCTDENEFRISVGQLFTAMFLLNDGKIYIENSYQTHGEYIYEPDKYCIDTFLENNGTAHLGALICFKAQPAPQSYETKSSCILISCFFILLTVAVYAWLPELRNLSGMVLMAYLLSFFVGFLFLAIMQILIMTAEATQNFCLVCTFIVYFSLLSAFCWMNVMNYDIWWTFCRTCGKNSQVLPEKPHKRFTYYALYAFGVPTALTALLATLEFSESLPVQHPLLPMIRLQGCFLYGTLFTSGCSS